ncbi:hypothetical protein [Flavobacterium sp.]|uniref:hypothetical protein n=1 Tax=Flavobacterium sp. TaxID=239 RepID=UPI00286DE510|nr:hypothetical protein [Flavobacterium sp.]
MQFIATLIKFNQVLRYVDETFTARFFYNVLKYVAIPFLVILVLCFIGSLLLNRYYFDALANKKKEIEQQINNFLTELIFSNFSFQETKARIRDFKKTPVFRNKWCKYLILNKLIHIKQNIREVNPYLILIIYKHFGLNNYSKKLINRSKWYYKSLGFYHYQSLDYKIKKCQIKPYLNSRNKYLKSNALIALIALSDEKFDVLNNYPKKIPSADEMKILDLIYQTKSEIPSSIYSWVKSGNSSVVILGIKLIVRYREKLCLPKIKFLLLNPDDEVRKQTIFAIRELFIVDASQLLMEHYKKEKNIRNKVSILKTLGVIGDYKTKNFAIELLETETEIDIKFELVNCIHKIDNTHFDTIELVNSSENELINKIYSHVNNPYLA